MAKVTTKFQVTLPMAIAKRYNIQPGDEIDWIAAGEVIRVIPPEHKVDGDDLESRLRMFDQATERARRRQRRPANTTQSAPSRGWVREDLYTRGRSR